jgi:hypothetical protein
MRTAFPTLWTGAKRGEARGEFREYILVLDGEAAFRYSIVWRVFGRGVAGLARFV